MRCRVGRLMMLEGSCLRALRQPVRELGGPQAEVDVLRLRDHFRHLRLRQRHPAADARSRG